MEKYLDFGNLERKINPIARSAMRRIKVCNNCGNKIYNRNKNAKYCIDCARVIFRQYAKDWNKRNRAK